MIITKKAINRRTMLRGMGATIALPFLDAMVPALAAARDTAGKPVKRLGVVYMPNGATMQQWTPGAQGPGFELTPILKPLAPYRDRVLVLSGLNDETAKPALGEGVGDHARAGATFLSGVHPKKTEGPDIRAGVSMDQLAARTLGEETQLASLELGLDSTEAAGGCDGNYSCAYVNSISWRSPTTPNPIEIDPRAVFERMFGESGSTDRNEQRARLREDRSVLDSVAQTLTQLRKELGATDRTKLNEYLDAVRDVERRIQRVEEQNTRELPSIEQPVGVPAKFEDHIKLMFDLQVLAYQADLTRVITFMLGREVSNRSYPQLGVPESHHGLSHHQDDPAKLEKLARINAYHMTMFAYYLEKLKSTPDGEGSLLDHVMILYGGGISDSNKHLHEDLPIVVAGGGAGRLKGGRHLRSAAGTPLMNLHVTLLDALGVPIEQIGDSNGRIDVA